jgi:hypothetical protein
MLLDHALDEETAVRDGDCGWVLHSGAITAVELGPRRGASSTTGRLLDG